MDIEITIKIEKVRGGFTVVVSQVDAHGESVDDNVTHGVGTTPHQATVQARKLVKDLLETIELTMAKETA